MSIWRLDGSKNSCAGSNWGKHLFINSCHALCKKGLKKTLIYHDENLTAKIRGKIDVSKNIKHNTARGRSDKFYCSYVDFTDDNIENRIVKAALLKSKKILKEKFSSEASVNGKINWLNHKFCGISDSSRSSVGSYRIASERNIRHQDIRIPVCEES